jgi:cytochrome c-type biogenesis protein CcmH
VRRVLALVVLAAALLAPAPAGADATWSPSDVQTQLMCPTCHQRLDQSDSAVAQRMKALILQWHAQGLSEQQVKDRFVTMFGPEVLAAPPARGFDLLAWLVPGLVLVGGAAVAGGLALAWARHRGGDADAAPLDPAMERRIDAELDAFE